MLWHTKFDNNAWILRAAVFSFKDTSHLLNYIIKTALSILSGFITDASVEFQKLQQSSQNRQQGCAEGK
jgi:hypothetical protein